MLFVTIISVVFASLFRVFDTPLYCGLYPYGQWYVQSKDSRDDRQNGYVLEHLPNDVKLVRCCGLATSYHKLFGRLIPGLSC